MNLFLIILSIAAAAAAGYVTGVLRTRSALSAEVEKARTAETAANTRLEAERAHTADSLRTQVEALRREFRATAAETAIAEGRQLRTEHLHALDALLTPLGRSIESFREQFLKGNADMGRHVADLVERTTVMGREAEELARALRGNSKLQGNWGEAVLGNLLDAAGLTEGRDYETQARTRDEEGHGLIPDVIVHLPGGRNVIIDSKVSLTAYTAYTAAGNDEERAACLREHVASVRRHIRELGDKHYDRYVENAIGHVLMFVPGEAAYVTAVAAAPELGTEAYARRVILLSPANLLMALQLAHNLWQTDRQSRSVGEIYASAEQLYRKFCGFARNFQQVGRNIRQLADNYERAEKQLTTGRGNIVSQLEGWKKKGLSPATDIPDDLKAGCDDAESPENDETATDEERDATEMERA